MCWAYVTQSRVKAYERSCEESIGSFPEFNDLGMDGLAFFEGREMREGFESRNEDVGIGETALG